MKNNVMKNKKAVPVLKFESETGGDDEDAYLPVPSQIKSSIIMEQPPLPP